MNDEDVITGADQMILLLFYMGLLTLGYLSGVLAVICLAWLG
jgi:hypothetical protein